MDRPVCIRPPLTEEACRRLRAGDMVLICGEVFTARDTAHRRMFEILDGGGELPFNPMGAVIFYAGPSPAPPGAVIGSIGPTTSGRMDPFTPRLLEAGVKGMIGKGKRASYVVEAIKKHGALYLAAPGGCAALLAHCVKKKETIAYEDLGPEAILCLTVKDLPAVVINDPCGRDLYEEVMAR